MPQHAKPSPSCPGALTSWMNDAITDRMRLPKIAAKCFKPCIPVCKNMRLLPAAAANAHSNQSTCLAAAGRRFAFCRSASFVCAFSISSVSAQAGLSPASSSAIMSSSDSSFFAACAGASAASSSVTLLAACYICSKSARCRTSPSFKSRTDAQSVLLRNIRLSIVMHALKLMFRGLLFGLRSLCDADRLHTACQCHHIGIRRRSDHDQLASDRLCKPAPGKSELKPYFQYASKAGHLMQAMASQICSHCLSMHWYLAAFAA